VNGLFAGDSLWQSWQQFGGSAAPGEQAYQPSGMSTTLYPTQYALQRSSLAIYPLFFHHLKKHKSFMHSAQKGSVAEPKTEPQHISGNLENMRI
jgi:hypothetical protein